MKLYIFVFFILTLTGCASSSSLIPELPISKPPQLWSHHKQMNIPANACAFKGYNALKSLGFSSVVRNGNYVYGNYHSNRAAVKCVSSGKGSFLYLAVAGPDKETVEELRNEISWKM